MAPADITLNQLGGRGRLSAMMGAKDFFSENDGRTLQFKFRGCKACNAVKITLNAMDLYDLEFIKIGRLNRKTYELPITTVETLDGIGVENLKPAIESVTGLYLSM